MTDDFPNTPPELMVRILTEEVAALRSEAGRCNATYGPGRFIARVRCRLPRCHMGEHRAFGAGGNGSGPLAYWCQTWMGT